MNHLWICLWQVLVALEKHTWWKQFKTSWVIIIVWDTQRCPGSLPVEALKVIDIWFSVFSNQMGFLKFKGGVIVVLDQYVVQEQCNGGSLAGQHNFIKMFLIAGESSVLKVSWISLLGVWRHLFHLLSWCLGSLFWLRLNISLVHSILLSNARGASIRLPWFMTFVRLICIWINLYHCSSFIAVIFPSESSLEM